MRTLFSILLALVLVPASALAQVVEYYHLDAVGNVRAVTDAQGRVIERHDYLPFGAEWNPQLSTQPLHFTAKERDAETGLDYFGARYYGSNLGRFTTVDPVYTWRENIVDPQRWNRYAYGRNNPLRYIDPDGREPVRVQAGTIGGFVAEMNSSPSKVGRTIGSAAAATLARFGDTSGLEPSVTPYFNSSSNRYVYTTGGGWIDMVHFLFYAGRAYQASMRGSSTPIDDAVKEGYNQELMDTVTAPWSAYSYEDLPSDRFGAIFAIRVFDPASKATLGEQVQGYLQALGATGRRQAPNWRSVPAKDSRNPPTFTNETTKPRFTK